MALVLEEIKQKYQFSPDHGFDHVLRVYNVSLEIGKREKADLEILEAAALLHDIAMPLEKENPLKCHAEEGAKIAEKYLQTIDFSKDKILAVCYCIRTHRYSQEISPQTLEAKILQDADRLDSLGAIGIARAFSYGALKNQPLYDPEIFPNSKYDKTSPTTTINHFYEKLLKIEPNSFNTETAKIMAKTRTEFLKKYLIQFMEEWQGYEIT